MFALIFISIYLLMGVFLIFYSREIHLKIDKWFVFFMLIFWPIAVGWGFIKAFKKIRGEK